MNIDRDELIAELLALEPALRRVGVRHVALFGSRARRDNRPDSDIDLLIDVDEQQKFSLLDMVGVQHEVEDRVRLPANVFLRRSLDADLLSEARRDQLPVF